MRELTLIIYLMDIFGTKHLCRHLKSNWTAKSSGHTDTKQCGDRLYFSSSFLFFFTFQSMKVAIGGILSVRKTRRQRGIGLQQPCFITSLTD